MVTQQLPEDSEDKAVWYGSFDGIVGEVGGRLPAGYLSIYLTVGGAPCGVQKLCGPAKNILAGIVNHACIFLDFGDDDDDTRSTVA